MKVSRFFLISLLFASSALAGQQSFNSDPDVYRGAFYGYLVTGAVSAGGVRLSQGEAVVHTVSYVHSLKNGQWYRSVKVSSKLTCRLASKTRPGFSVIEIDAYLSLSGMRLIKVSPLLVERSDGRLPEKACVNSVGTD